MKITPQIYLTSDTHLFHTNLWKIWGRPEDADKKIVENWNKTISKHDTILHLGDVIFSNKERAIEIFSKLNGTKYLVRGNHDGQSETWFKDIGFVTVEPIIKHFKNKYDHWITVLFTHEPIFDLAKELPNTWFNIHGHMHGNTHRGTLPNAEHFYDVGVDGNNFTPVPLYIILNEFFKIIEQTPIDK